MIDAHTPCNCMHGTTPFTLNSAGASSVVWCCLLVAWYACMHANAITYHQLNTISSTAATHTCPNIDSSRRCALAPRSRDIVPACPCSPWHHAYSSPPFDMHMGRECMHATSHAYACIVYISLGGKCWGIQENSSPSKRSVLRNSWNEFSGILNLRRPGVLNLRSSEVTNLRRPGVLNLWSSEVANLWRPGVLNLWSSEVANLRRPGVLNHEIGSMRNSGIRWSLTLEVTAYEHFVNG
jgi:hypothetical protein